MKEAPASVGMQRPDEMHETVEILQAWGLTLRVKKVWRFPLANREAEGGEDGGDGGESDVNDYAPLIFILVGHCCDSS